MQDGLEASAYLVLCYSRSDVLTPWISREWMSALHVTGIIVKCPVLYNPGWTFHYEPESISFFVFATEICDATIDYVQEHIDEAGGSFLPGLRWCPWSSRLVSQLGPWPCI
jgi:hypothetical protein